MKSTNWKDLKVGDTIKILRYPNSWSSFLCNRCPSKAEYPYTATIEAIEHKGDYSAAKIGDYGWNLLTIEFELINTENYEIY